MISTSKNKNVQNQQNNSRKQQEDLVRLPKIWSTYILLHKQLPKKNVIENNRAIKIAKKVVFGEKFKHLLKDTTEKQFNIIKMSFLLKLI